jgi:hypothetical protein
MKAALARQKFLGPEDLLTGIQEFRNSGIHEFMNL